MARSVMILLFALLMVPARAQTPEYLELVKAEAKLEQLFIQLYSDTLSDTGPILSKIDEIMPIALTTKGAMEFPWSKLTHIGVVTSGDRKIRVFTWHVMDDPNTYRYFGYLQIRIKRDKVKVYELIDNQKGQRDLRKLEQSTDHWYGKLYYSIVTNTYRRKKYYTLLGMDFNNTHSRIKTIETLIIQRQKPVFTQNLYTNGSDHIDRMVLEYSSTIAISVRFDPEMAMITFDHLVPFHPVYIRNYEFYGPDGSFDGLEFSGGKWIFREDIDARNLN